MYLTRHQTQEGPRWARDGHFLPLHEVWASGVTYLRSREARKAEWGVGDVYEKVYSADRPELFFKASGWRVQEHQQMLHIRTKFMELDRPARRFLAERREKKE